MSPASAVGSVLGWIAQGVPIILAEDNARAGRFVSRLLYTVVLTPDVLAWPAASPTSAVDLESATIHKARLSAWCDPLVGLSDSQWPIYPLGLRARCGRFYKFSDLV
ncbi:MAG: hypothetical protein JXB10_18400 [Pirellulales bacterium]|nr:hypothetical protein [Pirellulales bacterium]